MIKDKVGKFCGQRKQNKLFLFNKEFEKIVYLTQPTVQFQLTLDF